MSFQTRIDQFFKSTSSNKAISSGAKQKSANVLDRSRTGRVLSLKNGTNGRSRNFGNSTFATQPDAKKSRKPTNSSMKVSSDDVVFVESIRRRSDVPIGKSSADLSKTEIPSSDEKSVASEHSSTVAVSTTATKKTIKGFAKSCNNTPPANRTKGKISLKRRCPDSPAISSSLPVKKSPIFREDIVNISKKRSTEILQSSGASAKGLSSEYRENPSQSLELDAIAVADENVRKSCAEKCNSDEDATSLTPKKRKFRDLSSSRNSQSSSGWKVAVSIETPDRWMTALSSDWQRILGEENVGGSLGDFENLCNQSAPTGKTCYNACVKQNSPRRALFSPENSPRKGTANTTRVIDEIANTTREMNETANSTREIDETVNSTREMNETANSTREINGTANLPIKINGSANLPTKINGTANSPTKINGTANSLTKVNENANSTTKINGSANSPTKINGTANSLKKVNENVNSTTKINGSANSPTKINGTANSLTKVTESASLPTERINPSSPLQIMTSLPKTPTKVNVPSNSPQNMANIPKTPTKVNCTLSFPEKLTNLEKTPTKVIVSSNPPQEITNIPKTPTKVIVPSNPPQKMANIPITPTKVIVPSNPPQKIANPPKTPTKRTELLATPTKSLSRSASKSSFSPRVKYSPRKVHKERVDTNLATTAVEHLNQAKQGIIPPNDFDLEFIYTKKEFEIEYGNLNANAAIRYEARDVQVPEEKHADHFFMVLVNVFSKPTNCGYFDDNELDTIFSTLTLSPEAQSLLVRILKRKRGWHRVNGIKYPEIDEDLGPVFRELVRHGFLDDDIAKEEIAKMLKLLQADEVRSVCQAMKINHRGTKPSLIGKLTKLSERKNSLFAGMKSPSTALFEKVNSLLDFCIRIPDKIENLFERIFILLIPNQDPKENIAEAFRMLAQVHFGEKTFPTTPNERFPIFRNRLHLIRYAEARSAWKRIINASEDKDWETVRALGKLAYDHLRPLFENDRNGDEAPSLPSHVRRFDANYPWIKVMSKSIEGFKKTKESIPTAAEFLQALVSPNNQIPGNRTRWYSELAMIESHHRKNFETSAEITIRALHQDNLSEIDVAEMLERARKLVRSKSVSANTKERINIVVRQRQEMFVSNCEPRIEEIEATVVAGNTTGSKSTWSINIGGASTGYLRVEDVALRHYLGKGFRGGVHCEGALPVTIFATLLWDAIYTIPVPGAFVSSYQDAPLDLYTSHFIESRREHIEERLKLIRRLGIDYLSDIMHEDFVKYRHYESLVHGNLFQNSDDFKDFIECLGMDAVVGICERLASNYNQWKAGFPDLAVWNPVTKKCKIVEVKGPGDSLSTKQKLWIQFLECLGVDVEVCVVKGTTRRYAA